MQTMPRGQNEFREVTFTFASQQESDLLSMCQVVNYWWLKATLLADDSIHGISLCQVAL